MFSTLRKWLITFASMAALITLLVFGLAHSKQMVPPPAQQPAPATDPVQPAELAATLYRLLGININTDPRIRPFIGTAGPVAALV